MLDTFIAAHRAEIIRRCRMNAARRPRPGATDPDVHGVPRFLDQLMERLRRPRTSGSEIGASAAAHGHDLLRRGWTVSDVVHDYGEVCQSVTQLAAEADARIPAGDFCTLNRCLDEAIAGAVTAYGREHEQSRLDRQAARNNEQLGFFAHELRNLVNTATIAFGALKTGQVGVDGSTAAVLDRSLAGLRDLIARSLDDVRVTGRATGATIPVAVLIREVAASAVLEATARGTVLRVLPADPGLAVGGDAQVLSAVVTNLLQNAFKFTRPRTAVTLSVDATVDRVCIHVEDECGGLPGSDGDHEELFLAFTQKGADRSGAGLGLAYSRRAAEANHGRLSARSLPGKGCVFTLDLPRRPSLR